MSPAGAETRRTLLTRSTVAAVGLAGLGSVALTGCGTSSHRHIHVPPAARPGDVELLNSALAVEQRSIAAYTAAAPLLSGVAQHAASRFLGQELQHAGELRRLIKELGGRAHNPRSSYDFGQPHGDAALLGLLHSLEQAQIGAYLQIIPRVSSPVLRQALAAIMANDAQHIAVLRAERGVAALPGPFLSADE